MLGNTALPSWIPDHIGRAVDALDRCDTDTAHRLCVEILEAAPNHVDALKVLVCLLQATGPMTAAIAVLQRIQRLTPDDLAVTQELSGLLLRAGRLREAEVQARNAVRLSPDDPMSHTLLAMSLTDNHQPQAGEFHYRRVLELARPDAITIANFAWNLKLQGRLAEARRLYERAVALDPAVLLTWLGWAQTEEAGRDLPRASRFLARARCLDPSHDTHIFQAALLARQGALDDALAVLEGASGQSADVAGDVAGNGWLERGRILDRMGRHDEAFEAFTTGKAMIRESGRRYADQEAADLFARLANFFIADRLKLLPPPAATLTSPQPIFVTGAPRSGTTLVEQILSAHPAVAAGDELPAMAAVAAGVTQTLGSPLAYPEALSELWMGDQRDGLERMRDDYLRRARRLVPLSPGKSLFTDKMPFNELHLGLIALTFPSAPVVHVLRHPLDVVLSMMSHDLTHGFNCASSLESAARHCGRMLDLVAHYRREMPLRYLPLRYEDLVQDLEPNVRRLLGFVGLGFDRRCLRFDENRRYARTASYAQVTEKLYSRSLYRYRNYMRHLKPVIPLLEPAIHSLGYEI
ncbi:tetratricopeptide repeat-containing sulfotransferase family protein [Azospirillum soli]|uniref:tetratricopeptide repeat-containing sulfotransferase family protein n=1 Tax=Azospirillum soli TaxID=1304799 RepID=UPI001AE82E2A|nr:sulfotransferase [Azospirillum soli]MBP2314352.1 tetratricopeptide (TPR) repeat protein [Azospirillum soli]